MPLIGAEAAAAAALTFFASAIASAYAADWIGLPIVPVAILAVSSTAAIGVLARLRRVAAPDRSAAATAAAAVVLLRIPYRYSIGSFTEQSYFAQVASELFALGMWWAAIVWDEQPWRGAAPLFALFGVAAFLTWPIWIGPLAIAFAVVAL